MLLDNGRTRVLADEVGRQALHCIRCSACLNVCPVYSRTGGHAYGSVYPGPIGAILTPQLIGIENAPSLPFASSLCGACYEVCPVKIDIPTVLLHLRATGGRGDRRPGASGSRCARSRWVFGSAAALRARPAPRPARAAAVRPRRHDPAAAAAARRLDEDARPPARRAAELPRLVEQSGGERARDGDPRARPAGARGRRGAGAARAYRAARRRSTRASASSSSASGSATTAPRCGASPPARRSRARSVGVCARGTAPGGS